MHCSIAYFLLFPTRCLKREIFTKQQRIVGLFLLRATYITENIKHNPFMHVLFLMFDVKHKLHERLLIYERQTRRYRAYEGYG
jgi:plasmid rolling circle replication initiator protein Rep